MNGNWRREDLEDNQCFGNRENIRLRGILTSQQRKIKVEIDGKRNYVFDWRKPSVVRKTLYFSFIHLLTYTAACLG
jgi:hypothetical protein